MFRSLPFYEPNYAALPALPLPNYYKRERKVELFPVKLHRLLCELKDDGRSDVISFTADGSAFVIHKSRMLIKEILPKYKYMRQKNISSFRRQLYNYGFQSGDGGYRHPLFRRDFPELAKGMKKTIKSDNNSDSDDEQEQVHLDNDELHPIRSEIVDMLENSNDERDMLARTDIARINGDALRREIVERDDTRGDELHRLCREEEDGTNTTSSERTAPASPPRIMRDETFTQRMGALSLSLWCWGPRSSLKHGMEFDAANSLLEMSRESVAAKELMEISKVSQVLLS